MEWGNIDYQSVANGLLFVVLGVLSFIGYRSGNKAHRIEAEPTASMVGALVDASAVRDLTAELKRHTAELAALREQGKDNAHMLARRSESLAENIEEHTIQLRELHMEMIRGRAARS